jgi:ABC-type antimicrobial peptide transport system permease subunit
MNYRYIWKEIRHHRHRTIVNVLGIAVGIALFVSINAVSAAYQRAISLPFKNIGADIVVQRAEKRSLDSGQPPASMRGIRLPFSNQILSAQDMEKLRTISGIDAMAASLLLWEFDQGGFKTIMGVDLTAPSLGPIKVKDWLAQGHFFSKAGEAVLEKHFAKFHQINLGDTYRIGGHSFYVVGLLEIKEGSQVASANIYLPLADAQSLLAGSAGDINIAYLHMKNPAQIDEIKTQISKTLPSVTVTSSDSFLELMGGMSQISSQFSLVVSLVALAGAFFLIIKTMIGNLVERSREIGILKAIGWTSSDIQKQLLGEVVLQSVMGGIAGIAAGYLISYLLGYLSIPVSTPWELNLTPAFAKDAAAAVKTIRLPVSFSAGLTAAALALSVFAGGLASYFMGRRMSKMKPADILRRL